MSPLFRRTLERVSGGDKTRPVVFLCLSSECWKSYNACIHAIEAGYADVLWYRGGTNAWAVQTSSARRLSVSTGKPACGARGLRWKQLTTRDDDA